MRTAIVAPHRPPSLPPAPTAPRALLPLVSGACQRVKIYEVSAKRPIDSRPYVVRAQHLPSARRLETMTASLWRATVILTPPFSAQVLGVRAPVEIDTICASITRRQTWDSQSKRTRPSPRDRYQAIIAGQRHFFSRRSTTDIDQGIVARAANRVDQYRVKCTRCKSMIANQIRVFSRRKDAAVVSTVFHFFRRQLRAIFGKSKTSRWKRALYRIEASRAYGSS